jgi:uncharacterized membrane protein
MDLIRISVSLSTLLCSLVAGFVFAFAVVVMPGIKSLSDHDFLHAFKVMDRVIQNHQPIFILVWLGSAVVLLISTVLGIWKLEGVDRLLLIIAFATYLFGVQLPTATINVPLNNQLQSRNLDIMTKSALKEARMTFEARWIRWNSIRTVLATLTTALLICILIRL